MGRRRLWSTGKHEGDNQRVNSNSFRKSQADEHVNTDQRLCFGVAANCVECLACSDTDADTWTNGSQADGQCYSEGSHDENLLKENPYLSIYDVNLCNRRSLRVASTRNQRPLELAAAASF